MMMRRKKKNKNDESQHNNRGCNELRMQNLSSSNDSYLARNAKEIRRGGEEKDSKRSEDSIIEYNKINRYDEKGIMDMVEDSDRKKRKSSKGLRVL